MPNDAKLGLVIGVGLVIAVAVVFFRKDIVTAQAGADNAAGAAINPALAPHAARKAPSVGTPPAAEMEPTRPTAGKSVARPTDPDAAEDADGGPPGP